MRLFCRIRFRFGGYRFASVGSLRSLMLFCLVACRLSIPLNSIPSGANPLHLRLNQEAQLAVSEGRLRARNGRERRTSREYGRRWDTRGYGRSRIPGAFRDLLRVLRLAPSSYRQFLQIPRSAE